MLMKAVPLVLSSPTLSWSENAGDAWRRMHVPIPLFADLENASSVGLYVLTGVGLPCSLVSTSGVDSDQTNCSPCCAGNNLKCSVDG
jgi:hypothetical protein